MHDSPGLRLFVLGLLLAAGCGRSDSSPADTAVPIDTVVVTGPPDARIDSATVPALAPPGSTGVANQGSGAPLDSLQAGIALLAQRVDALARSNDSLRNAIAARLTVAAATSAVDSASGVNPSGQAILQEASANARRYGPRAFWAFIVLVLTFYVVSATVYVVDRLAERNARRRLFFKRLVPIARVLLWTIALIFIIRVIFAVDARGLLAALTAIGVAVGFAAQDIMKNIFGGLVIVFDQPFQVGDKIEVGGSYGEVVSIGLRSTRIVTPDDSLVSVPNAQIVDGQVSNANTGALDCQVVIDLYLPGWVDEAVAKRIAYQATASSRYVFLKKPIVVLVKDEYHDTFVTHLKVKAYVLDTRYEFAFMSEVTERSRVEFRRQGLLAPWHGAHAWVNISPQGGNGETLPATAPARGDIS